MFIDIGFVFAELEAARVQREHRKNLVDKWLETLPEADRGAARAKFRLDESLRFEQRQHDLRVARAGISPNFWGNK